MLLCRNLGIARAKVDRRRRYRSTNDYCYRIPQISRTSWIYANDAYILGCAINQRAPILSLDGVLKERAKSLNLEVIEVTIE